MSRSRPALKRRANNTKVAEATSKPIQARLFEPG